MGHFVERPIMTLIGDIIEGQSDNYDFICASMETVISDISELTISSSMSRLKC